MSVGETMGGMSQTQQQTADEVGPGERVTPIFKILRESINLRQRPTIVKKRSISGNNAIYGHSTYGVYGQNYYGSPDGMIWESTTFGIWGSAEWGPIQDVFILGHAGAGILGTSKLGSTDIEWITYRVTNPNNEYIETFRTSTFEDSNDTTADWDTTNFKIEFADGEEVVSEVVAKNNESYSQGKITLKGSNLNNLTLYLSANGGGNWEEVTNATTHNFINASIQGIHFKMVAGSDIESTFPLTMPFGFGCAVNDIKIEYS